MTEAGAGGQRSEAPGGSGAGRRRRVRTSEDARRAAAGSRDWLWVPESHGRWRLVPPGRSWCPPSLPPALHPSEPHGVPSSHCPQRPESPGAVPAELPKLPQKDGRAELTSYEP